MIGPAMVPMVRAAIVPAIVACVMAHVMTEVVSDVVIGVIAVSSKDERESAEYNADKENRKEGYRCCG
jgi:hypothetical protein